MIAGSVADDLIVHVGDVHYVVEAISGATQEAAKNIHRDKCAEVSDVPIIVDGRAAGVHPNPLRFDGAKLFELSRECVEES